MVVVVWLLAFFGTGHLPLLSSQSRILQLQSALMSGSATRGQGGVSVPTAYMEGGFGRGWHVLPPQSCSWPRAGAPGRGGSHMWLPELSPPPSPDHPPSQGSLKLDAEQAAYAVVPGVTLSLAREDSLVRTVDGEELLALPQQLIFKLQYVSVPSKGRRLPGTADGWDVPLGNGEAAKQTQECAQVQPEQRDQTGQSFCAFNCGVVAIDSCLCGLFLGLQPMPNLDHTGSDVAELSSGSVLLKHKGEIHSSSTLVTRGTQA